MGYISAFATMAKPNRWVQIDHLAKQKTPQKVFLALAEKMGYISAFATMAKPNRWVQIDHLAKQKNTPKGVSCFGGKDGIRTHVPGITDNCISSAARYDHFDTFP